MSAKPKALVGLAFRLCPGSLASGLTLELLWARGGVDACRRGPLAVEVVKKVRQKRVREKDDPVEVARPDVQKEAKVASGVVPRWPCFTS